MLGHRKIIEVTYAEFSTLSLAVLLKNPKNQRMRTAHSKVENTAQI
jgi:hypothetical protein